MADQLSATAPAEQVLFSLYVGDIDSAVTGEQLIKAFSGIPDFHSAVLCKDSLSGRPLGYGYVNYNTLQSAMEAVNTLNHTVMNGKAVRVMWSQSNSEARTSGVGNLFVKNMARSIDNLKLHDIFSEYGTILSCKVEVSQGGESKGFGFVQFATKDSANNAIEKLNGREIEGKELYVAHFISRRDRIQPDGSFTNLYIKNLDKEITEELLEKIFSKFGKITSLVISTDDNGVSKGFGFINFENAEEARRAKESMHGTQMGSNILYVARAQKKAEREKILRIEFNRLCKERAKKGLNLYVKNISDKVDDIQLRAYFTPCGNITSAKVMRTDKGLSRGFGFVSFSRPEEADFAVNKYNGAMFHGKPLYVAKAQSKEERKAYLQTLFARHGVLLPGPLPSSSSFTPFSVRHPGQLQVYQPPNFRLGWRPNGFARLNGHRKPPLRPMLPNSTSPYRGRINGHHMIHQGINYPILPFMPRQFRGPQQRAGIANGLGALTSTTAPRTAHEDLSRMLTAAPPNERKDILAQRLYPLVKNLKSELSPKITEMLLEMDHSELLVLLESPESLSAKVEEAMQLLGLSKSKENSIEEKSSANSA